MVWGTKTDRKLTIYLLLATLDFTQTPARPCPATQQRIIPCQHGHVYLLWLLPDMTSFLPVSLNPSIHQE